MEKNQKILNLVEKIFWLMFKIKNQKIEKLKNLEILKGYMVW